MTHKKKKKICAICPQISAKKHDFCFEEYPAIMCGICGQTALFMEFRVEAEALTDDLCIQLGMGGGGGWLNGQISSGCRKLQPSGPREGLNISRTGARSSPRPLCFN